MHIFYIANYANTYYNTDMNGADFCIRIDELLTARNKKRSDLYAAIPDISAHSIYDWTRRNTIPSADIALKIAQFLNTSVEYLLTGIDTNPLSAENAELKKRLNEIYKLTNY